MPPLTKQLDYQQESARLYQKRKDVRDFRLFQLITDYQYKQCLKDLPSELSQKKIIVTCLMAGGLGDVVQTFQVAQILTRNLPGFPIKIVIECRTSEIEKVSKLYSLGEGRPGMKIYNFEQTMIEVQFVDVYDYFAKQAAMPGLKQEAACLLSVAAPLNDPILKGQTVLEEYGHGLFIQEILKGEHDGMGFNASNEDGLIFPVTMSHLPLTDFKTPWLVNAGLDEKDYLSTHHLYHMYIHHWTIQMIGLYAVISLEQNNKESIDLVMPCPYSLQVLIDTGALNKEYLLQFNIGTVIKLDPSGEERENLKERGEGKTLRILSGSILKEDMERIENNSQSLFGCTGDVSVTTAFLRNKIPFYEVYERKDRFFTSWIQTAAEIGLSAYAAYLKLFESQIKEEKTIYDRAFPPMPGHVSIPTPQVTLDKKEYTGSVIPKLTKLAMDYGDKIGQILASSPKLREEAQQFDSYVQQHLNILPRLLGRVSRALLQTNYPQLLVAEAKLLEEFKAGGMSEEQLVDEFNLQLDATTSSPSAPRP